MASAESQAKVQRRVKPSGWAIRDDGLLFPATPKVLAQPNYRPYHGDIEASLEDRMLYLQGQFRRGNYQPNLTPGTFDIGTATRGQMIDFAERNYNAVLDASQDIDAMREHVRNLAVDAGDMGGPEQDEELATGRQHRINGPKAKASKAGKDDGYPKEGDDAAAVARARELAARSAAAGGVASGVNIPRL